MKQNASIEETILDHMLLIAINEQLKDLTLYKIKLLMNVKKNAMHNQVETYFLNYGDNVIKTISYSTPLNFN